MTKHEVKGQIKKWYSMGEYVDIDTGELITKELFEKEYYKTNINRKIEIHENYGTIKYIHECRKRNQLKFNL